MEARIDSALNAEAVQAINDTAFTIEADKVEFKRGYTAHVTASTNLWQSVAATPSCRWRSTCRCRASTALAE